MKIVFESKPCTMDQPSYAATGNGWLRRGAHAVYIPSNYCMGLAHDCMDHVDMMSFEDEIMAHATEIWMRPFFDIVLPPRYTAEHGGDNGWWNRRGHHQVLILNIHSMLKHRPIIRPTAPSPRLPCEIEARVRRALKNQNSIYRNHSIKRHYLSWFRKGYWFAQKRYAKMGRRRACTLFQDLCHYFDDGVVKGIPADTQLTIDIDDTKGIFQTQQCSSFPVPGF